MNANIKTYLRLVIPICAVAMISSCSPESPKLKGFESAEKIKTTESATFNPKVDILFVIDDSGSMKKHQAKLSSNIAQFTAAIEKSKLLDYHIGVVTSSMDRGLTENDGLEDNGSEDEAGRPLLLPCDQPGHPDSRPCGDGQLARVHTAVPFVTRATPNAAALLAKNLIVGISGSPTEKFFAPVRAALTEPMLSTRNAGFYRREASIVVIFLTDSDDQSTTMDVPDYIDFLKQLKNGDPLKALTYGVIIPASVSNDVCNRDGEPTATKLEEAIRVGGGFSYGLCDADYGTKLGAFAKDVSRKVSKILYLDRLADDKSIRVNFGTQVIPRDVRKGWTYNAALNAVVFGDELELTIQPDGTQMEVNYNAARYDKK